MKKILVWICLFVILTASCLPVAAVSMVPDEETAKEHGLRILYLNINGWDTPHCYLDENDNIPNQILLRTHEKLDVSQYVKGEVAEFYGLEVFYVQYSFQWNGIYRYTVTTVDFLTDEELEAWASEHDFIATAEFSYYKEISEPAPAVKGDVNRDGAFDSMDYVLIKRSYFGTYPEEELYCDMGDLNGNREIDSMDYVLLKRAYFGTYEIDAPEFITPDDNPILADFTFSLTWNCYGESSYDSQTGKLVKTTHTYKTNPDDYVTYYRLSNDEKQYIYNLITELDINSYPDIYDPQEGQLMSKPPMTLILSVDCNGTQKTIKAENIACEFTSKDEKGQDFLAVCKAIINTLTATEEWKALPDYEFYYD